MAHRHPFVLLRGQRAAAAPLRTISLAHMLWAGAVAACLLLACGVGIGLRWAAPAADAHSRAATAIEPGKAPLALAAEHLGALSARLVRLESQAARLGERFGVGHKAKPGSGGPMLAPRLAPTTADELGAQLQRLEGELQQLADAAADHQVGQMRLPTRRPIEGGEVSSPFGNRSDPINGGHAFHAGLDFAAPHGTPIVAAAGGTVGFAGFRPDYGWTVEVDHGDGLATRYAHASRLLVAAGAIVMPGERIALVGSSGRSTGPHLHFEVLRERVHVNPRRYLAGL